MHIDEWNVQSQKNKKKMIVAKLMVGGVPAIQVRPNKT